MYIYNICAHNLYNLVHFVYVSKIGVVYIYMHKYSLLMRANKLKKLSRNHWLVYTWPQP